MTAVRLSVRLRVIDSFMIVGTGVLALSALASAYGGYRWLLAAAGGLLLGLAAAWASARFSLSAWPTTLLLVLSYFVFGSALAVPTYAGSGVVPTPQAFRNLATGAIESWRDTLTLATPLGQTGTVLVVPFVLGLLAAVVGALLLWRSKYPSTAAIAILLLFVAAATFGDRTTEFPLGRGAALILLSVVWLRWRAMRHIRANWSRRLVLTTAVLVVAGAAAGGAAIATGGGDHRQVLRDHVDPPFDPLDYASPLSKFRAYVKDLKETELLDVKGLPAGARIRIATMDTFDGIVWNVSGGPTSPTSSGTFKRIRPTRTNADRTVDVSVTVKGYSGVWVPSVGATQSYEIDTESGKRDSGAEARVVYNKVTGTTATVGGVATGQTYHLTAAVSEQPSEQAIKTAESALDVQIPRPSKVPEGLIERADSWLSAAGAADAGARVQALVEAFHKGYFSDGTEEGSVTSPAGHGSKRISDLVTPDEMVGDDEQYSSALAMELQTLGIPARVVLGFAPTTGQTTLRGDDIAAWVEVKFDKLGWVTFDPTPDKDRTLHQRTTDPDPEPQPQVIQPPDVPKAPANVDENLPQGAGSLGGDSAGNFLRVVLGIGLAAGKTILILSPLWLILLVKFVRRRRRRRNPDLVARLSGGWKEIADQARDLGTRVATSGTRYETSVLLTQKYPQSDVAPLAVIADRHIFGPQSPTDEDVQNYWIDVDTARKRMRKSMPRWRRLLSWFSLVSVPWRDVRARLRGTGRAGIGKVRRMRLKPIRSRRKRGSE